ncbi:hypothetical protein MF271_01145 (plasmid) [Deinococcus sp. KNUC1210]|uniref:hypothetical protein n=1 Tax=Deinococcus sp. KNUC1210 TaxID=2917691 RepID=UPI001EEFCBDA|nr:hypothetical protein [Deinococcus sp. KNUC1210]ULH13966.1 hypothetical protein MF271_01145 [Deinococcus sp. KNUC1210]
MNDDSHESTYAVRAARSVRLVQDALARLDEQQQHVPRDQRDYSRKAILEAVRVVGESQGEVIGISTLRRNSAVAQLIREARQQAPEPPPDFSQFGALQTVYSSSKRARSRRAKKFAVLSRAELAYWVVGRQEQERHLHELRVKLEAIPLPDGLWPRGTELPNPLFKVSSSAPHRYQQMRERVTRARLLEMLKTLHERVDEHLRAIDVIQRLYIEQLLR